jgi:large subunit ribosomal protein L18
MGKASRASARLKRKKRVRKKIRGTAEIPRLSVFKSSKHIYAQVVDDISARTLVDASTLSKEIQQHVQGRGGNKEGATIVGRLIAKRALEKGVKNVVFDRNGFIYHGRIEALAETAREHGLEF